MTKAKRGLKKDSLQFLLGDVQIAQVLKENAENSRNNNENAKLGYLPIEQIIPSPWQPRNNFEPSALQELAESIKSQGVAQPILVRRLKDMPKDSYELIAGERRWRAAQMAGLDKIPALVKDIDDESALALAIIENIQRADLNPLEEARGLKKLQEEFSLTQEEIAKKIGKKRSSISNILRLLDLPVILQGYVERAQLSAGHAKILLGLPEDLQIKLAAEIIQKDLSVRATEQLVQDWQREKTSVQKFVVDPNIRKLEQCLSEKLAAEVRINHQKSGAGKMVIKYYTLEELDNILDKLDLEGE